MYMSDVNVDIRFRLSDASAKVVPILWTVLKWSCVKRTVAPFISLHERPPGNFTNILTGLRSITASAIGTVLAVLAGRAFCFPATDLPKETRRGILAAFGAVLAPRRAKAGGWISNQPFRNTLCEVGLGRGGEPFATTCGQGFGARRPKNSSRCRLVLL
eukprot:symbB.v1.2.036405.t1/scaffold5131.1/size30539/3